MQRMVRRHTKEDQWKGKKWKDGATDSERLGRGFAYTTKPE